MIEPRFGGAVLQREVDNARRQTVLENSGRLAQASVTHRTSGAGQLTLPDPVSFTIVFTEEPTVTSGYAIERHADEAYWQHARARAFVRRWVTEPDDPTKPPVFWVGAYLGFTVDVPALPIAEGEDISAYREILVANPPDCVVVHHLMFRAQAFKRIRSVESRFEELI